MKNDLKQKIKGNQLTIGSWLTIGNTSTAEIMAMSGFDWLAIDMEHSSITFSEAQDMIRVIELSGIAPLVRVSANDPVIIKRVMDAGAHGVIVPMINSEDDARHAVNSVYYPPKGKRGVGLARAQKYGLDFEGYKKWLAQKAIVIAQIEHIDAITNLESILAVDGVDASLVGPYDLSASMGYPGEYDRTDVKNAIAKYLTVCKKMKETPGFHVVPPSINLLKEKIKAGYKFLGFSLDELFLAQKVKEELSAIKK